MRGEDCVHSRDAGETERESAKRHHRPPKPKMRHATKKAVENTPATIQHGASTIDAADPLTDNVTNTTLSTFIG